MTHAVLRDAETGRSRTGFITTRQLGGAVIRNRVRRRLREIVRAARPQLATGCWIVLIARSAAARANSKALHEEWERLAARAHLWRSDG